MTLLGFLASCGALLLGIILSDWMHGDFDRPAPRRVPLDPAICHRDPGDENDTPLVWLNDDGPVPAPAWPNPDACVVEMYLASLGKREVRE